MTTIRVPIYKVTDEVTGGPVETPEYKTPGAAAFDVSARLKFPRIIPGRGFDKIPLGIAMALPEGYEAQVRPRSGLGNKGIFCHFGTVDSDYRGEISIVLYNFTDEPFTVNPHMRIGQVVISPAPQAELPVVPNIEDLGTTARGAKGFGSTGE